MQQQTADEKPDWVRPLLQHLHKQLPTTYLSAGLNGAGLAFAASVVRYAAFRGRVSRVPTSLPGFFVEFGALGALVAAPAIGGAIGVTALALTRMERKNQVRLGVITTFGLVLSHAYVYGAKGTVPTVFTCFGVTLAVGTLYLWGKSTTKD